MAITLHTLVQALMSNMTHLIHWADWDIHLMVNAVIILHLESWQYTTMILLQIKRLQEIIQSQSELKIRVERKLSSELKGG